MWKVELIKPVTQNYFREDFFPRLFAYKKDAIRLVNEIKNNGGEAKISNVK